MGISKLRSMNQDILNKNGKLFNEMESIFRRLSSFEYALIKGEALSVFAYGSVGFRKSADIDLLVEKDSLKQVLDIFFEEGFIQKVPGISGGFRNLTRREKIMFANSHEIPPLYNLEYSFPVELDINLGLFWGEYKGKKIDIRAMMNRRINMEIYGVSIKSLCDIDAFIQMCLHHYREMNAIYTFKLKNAISTHMFQDVYNFYVRRFMKNPRALVCACQLYDITPYVYYLLYYANKIFLNIELEKQLCMFESEKGTELLECYGLNDSERRIWKIPFSERLDNPNLYNRLSEEMSESDLEKVSMVLSIYEGR